MADYPRTGEETDKGATRCTRSKNVKSDTDRSASMNEGGNITSVDAPCCDSLLSASCHGYRRRALPGLDENSYKLHFAAQINEFRERGTLINGHQAPGFFCSVSYWRLSSTSVNGVFSISRGLLVLEQRCSSESSQPRLGLSF